MLLVRVRSIRRWRVGNLQTGLRGLCPPSQWDAWGNPRKLLRWRCFWLRMTPVSLRVSNYSLTAAEPRSDRKGGRMSRTTPHHSNSQSWIIAHKTRPTVHNADNHPASTWEPERLIALRVSEGAGLAMPTFSFGRSCVVSRTEREN